MSARLTPFIEAITGQPRPGEPSIMASSALRGPVERPFYLRHQLARVAPAHAQLRLRKRPRRRCGPGAAPRRPAPVARRARRAALTHSPQPSQASSSTAQTPPAARDIASGRAPRTFRSRWQRLSSIFALSEPRKSRASKSAPYPPVTRGRFGASTLQFAAARAPAKRMKAAVVVVLPKVPPRCSG